jgi:predicted esterase
MARFEIATALIKRPLAVIALIVFLTPLVAQCQQAWRYRLRPGDHLVFTETVEKETIGPETQYKTTASFENHALVLSESMGGFTVAIQRNRRSAELLVARPGKKPPNDEDKRRFAERLSRQPDRLADANLLETVGGLRYAPSALREWPSRTLVGFEDFPQILASDLKTETKWRASGFLSAEFTVKGSEACDGRNCTLLEGEAFGGHVRLRYWIDDTTHLVQHATYQSDYGVFNGYTREVVTVALTSVAHDQTLEPWLASADMRLAALTALEHFSTLATSTTELLPIIASSDSEAATIALSVIARRRLPIDAAAIDATKLTPEGARLLAVLKRGTRFQPPPLPPGTTMQLYLDPAAGLVPYGLRIPRDFSLDSPAPLLVYLSGGPGVALDGLNGSWSALRGSEYAVLYPHALGMWWDKDSTDMFDGLLKKVTADLHVAASQTYLAGFSNGGSGTEFYAARWPERFGAAVSLMGAGECSVLDGRAVEQLAQVPLLLVHGRTDTVIPYECSQELFRKLQKRKANVRLELLDKGHEITLDNDQGLTLEFLRRAGETAAAQKINP